MGRNLGPLNIKDSYEGLVQISGSNQLTDGSGSAITSLSLDITGTATTASYVAGANVDGTVVTATSASYATTASFALNQTDTTYDLDSIQVGDDVAITLVGSDSSLDTVTLVAGTDITLTDDGSANITIDASVPSFDTGSLLVTGSVSDATITLEKGDGSTFDLTVDNVANATSASFATTASFALNVSTPTLEEVLTEGNVATTDITGSNALFSNITATSASFGHVQTTTGSAVIIGDEFVVLNADTPVARYAGLQVYDSGSGSPTTASFEWDGQQDIWIQVDEAGNSAAMLTGLSGSKGSETFPTSNTLLKGTGNHTVEDSSITDDGTLVTINANVSASGYVSASSFIGDGSQLTGISSDPFPYVGDAEITGSLLVSGSAIIGGNTTTISSTGANNVILNDFGTISGTTSNSLIAAGGVEDINTISAGLRNSIISGRNNTIQGGAETSVILGGLANTINASSGLRQAVILGSRQSSITGGSFYGQAIVGARGGSLTGPNAVLMGGQDNTISGESAGIFAGYNHTVSGLTSAAVGGRSATVSHQDSVVLGGNGLSTSKTEEAVVEHLSIYGDTFISSSTLGTGSLIDNLGQNEATGSDAIFHVVHATQAEYDALTPDDNTLYAIDESGDTVLEDTVISGSLIGQVGAITPASNTGSLDCSLGNYFTMTLGNAVDTRLEVSNIQIGQTINLKLTNNATAAGTISFASEFDFEGGTAFTATATTSAVDILTFVSFDGTSLQTVGVKNFS